MFAGNSAPNGWVFCEGQELPISENDALFNLIGTTFGGEGEETFAIPDMRGRAPMHDGTGPGLTNRVLSGTGGVEQVTLTMNQLPTHTHVPAGAAGNATSASPDGTVWASWAGTPYAAADAPVVSMHAQALGSTGSGAAHANTAPYVAVRFILSLFGVYPSQSAGVSQVPCYAGELRLISFNYPPTGWRRCDGQLLTTAGNPELFANIGYTYGGSGADFALPDLRGRRPVHASPDLSLGDKAGAETHTLSLAELPAHSHPVNASATGGVTSPAGKVWGADGLAYAAEPDVAMSGNAVIATAGGGAAHENMSPFLTLSLIVALNDVTDSE